MIGVVVVAVALALTFARPMEARSQEQPVTSQMAADLEAAAGGLHAQPERWADAARLYVVAAELRQQEDPAARRNLMIAANLYFQVGDAPQAIAALEAAGARALSDGDAHEARRLLARA